MKQKSVQFQQRTSFGEPWVLPANTGSEKSSLEPMYHPKNKMKEVFLTQTHLHRRVGFRLSGLKLHHDPLVLK